jgi:hypothetical protein
MNIEDNLRAALRREDPPPGFASRVLERMPPRRNHAWQHWRWAAAAAVLVVFVFSGVEYRRAQQRMAGERAKQQLMLALQITGSKVHVVQQKIQMLDHETN